MSIKEILAVMRPIYATINSRGSRLEIAYGSEKTTYANVSIKMHPILQKKLKGIIEKKNGEVKFDLSHTEGLGLTCRGAGLEQLLPFFGRAKVKLKVVD